MFVERGSIQECVYFRKTNAFFMLWQGVRVMMRAFDSEGHSAAVDWVRDESGTWTPFSCGRTVELNFPSDVENREIERIYNILQDQIAKEELLHANFR